MIGSDGKYYDIEHQIGCLFFHITKWRGFNHTIIDWDMWQICAGFLTISRMPYGWRPKGWTL